MFGIRSTLKLGSTVFGLSAILLLALPAPFLDLLALDSESEELIWAMRMIGITLVALAGNMWMNSQQRDDAVVRRVGIVMTVCATSLGALTLLIPADLTWFTYAYAAVGFAFGANYLVCLARQKY